MARVKTGAGKIEPLEGGTLIYNYDIDGDDLKPEHKKWLEENVIATAQRSPKGLVVLVDGTTDRLGVAWYNEQLAQRRAQNVVAYLRQRIPNYPWTFSTKWQGERKAEKDGDADDTANERYRAVLLATAEPGKVLPPRPKIPTKPKEFPKKPNEFPKPTPLPKVLDPCLDDRTCPAGKNFAVTIVAGTTGGEILEGANIHLLFRDLDNRLQTRYQLLAVGAGTPSPLPLAPMALGKEKRFSLAKPARVCRFGPKVVFNSFTIPLTPIPHPDLNVSRTNMLVEYMPDGMGVFNNPANMVLLYNIDSGIIPSLPGAHLSGGLLVPLSFCNGNTGAVWF